MNDISPNQQLRLSPERLAQVIRYVETLFADAQPGSLKADAVLALAELQTRRRADEPKAGTVNDVMCPHGYNRLAMKADGTHCAECPPEKASSGEIGPFTVKTHTCECVGNCKGPRSLPRNFRCRQLGMIR
jgi:hypothetical protein